MTPNRLLALLGNVVGTLNRPQQHRGPYKGPVVGGGVVGSMTPRVRSRPAVDGGAVKGALASWWAVKAHGHGSTLPSAPYPKEPQ